MTKKTKGPKPITEAANANICDGCGKHSRVLNVHANGDLCDECFAEETEDEDDDDD